MRSSLQRPAAGRCWAPAPLALAHPGAAYGCVARMATRHARPAASAGIQQQQQQQHLGHTLLPVQQQRQQQRVRRRVPLVVRAATEDTTAARVAMEGDIVTVNFTCKGPEGEVLQSTEEGEPITFEVGAGEIMGNALFQALDGAVRGLSVGDQAVIEAQGGKWDRDLLFTVPRSHPEVERLEGRYKNHGGLKEGMVIELANGSMALVMSCDEAEVVLDANNMMAGKTLSFEVQLLSVERQ